MLTLIGLASTASILWGVTAILHKKMLNFMSPHTLIFLIGILFGAMSIIFAFFFKKNITADLFDKKMPTVVWGWLILTVFLGSICAYFIYFSIMQKNSTHLVVALTYTSPLFVMLFSLLILNESISVISCIGCVLIVVGVICMSLH